MIEQGKYKRLLWFEPFLQEVKKQLGYPFDISKYLLLLQYANDEPWSTGKAPLEKLYGVCRVLFLQNHEHESIFRQLFLEYVVSELAYEDSMYVTGQAQVVEAVHDGSATITPKEVEVQNENVGAKDSTMTEPHDEDEMQGVSRKRYLNIILPEQPGEKVEVVTSPAGSRFQLTDNYLPLTTRQMVHGWRHLRKGKKFVPSNVLDVPATVKQIAQQGMLLHPVFEKKQVNSDNLLLILADRGGSMAPFHRLTDKLIETAMTQGGHSKAIVYYFYNCPVNMVYRKPNLTAPVRLAELYSKIKPDQTNALIISDAGAARGNMNEERFDKTMDFLNGDSQSPGLHKSAMFVVWMNPMPRHRWVNSTAAKIDKDKGTPMYPLMDEAYLNFLNVINKLMGK